MLTEVPNWQGQSGLSGSCKLAPEIVFAILLERREHPCDGCNMDRGECNGFPRRGNFGGTDAKKED